MEVQVEGASGRCEDGWVCRWLTRAHVDGCACMHVEGAQRSRHAVTNTMRLTSTANAMYGCVSPRDPAQRNTICILFVLTGERGGELRGHDVL